MVIPVYNITLIFGLFAIDYNLLAPDDVAVTL